MGNAALLELPIQTCSHAHNHIHPRLLCALVSQNLSVLASSAHRDHDDLLTPDVPVSRQLRQLSRGRRQGKAGDPGDTSDTKFTAPQLTPRFSRLSPANSEGCCKALPTLFLESSPTRRREVRLGSPRPQGGGDVQEGPWRRAGPHTESGVLHFNWTGINLNKL